MSTILPVADVPAVRAYARELIRRHPRELAATLGLYGLAAGIGLVGPRLLGAIVQDTVAGTTSGHVDVLAGLLALAVVAQTAARRLASMAAARFGEAILAELREEFVEKVLELPLSTVERAGTGDVVSRASRDVDALGRSARQAGPALLIALVTILLTVGAVLLTSPLLALPLLVVVAPLWAVARWYLRRATDGYLRENATYGRMTDGLAATVDGSTTVEALGLGARRVARTDADIAGSWAAERYTLSLRMVFLPVCEFAYVLPVAATLLFGGYAHTRGWVTIGQVTAATLYAQQLTGPIDELLSWLDTLQVGGASLARLLGVAQVPPDRTATGTEVGAGRDLVADGVRYAYIEGRDVLHGIDLSVASGERLAMVGPSGAGKSTLGRLLAGIHAPRSGSVELGGAELVELPLDGLRGEVALVTQEHHVFAGTLRENLTLARADAGDGELWAALAAVDAREWVDALPEQLDTTVGTGGLPLTPPQAQQLALARLVLLDPSTLVLDEATSLLDPRAARHLERSLAAVLADRTVIAIAHRLHTAHDADRVAVVDNGQIIELGPHQTLIAANGPYAALWRSWHGG